MPANMTKAHYEQPPAANDGAFYPNYSEFYDGSGMDYSHAAAAAGRNHPGISAPSEPNMPYPPGWDYGTIDVQMRYPLLSPGTVQGEEESLQPRGPWGYRTQAYPALIDTTMGGDTSAMADHMSQYVSVEEPAMADSMSHHGSVKDPRNDSYDSPRWPHPPPMGQISPSPSQGSYYASSPASGAGAHYSRHNSCSSLPAPRVAALEQIQFDARFHQAPDQAVSPGEGRLAPGGLQTGADSYAGQTTRQWGDMQSQTITPTTTTDHHAGTVSPAMTPSPRDTDTTSSQLATRQSARNPSNQRAPKANKRKEKPEPPARQTNKQKEAEAGGRSQAKKQKQQQQAQAGTEAKGQAEAPPTHPPVRHRNRDAANKCRAKTKKAVADLESTERAMSSEHRELSAVARGLRDEVLMLKTELLAHGTCDDDVIQHYLTNQARRVGYGTAQPPGQEGDRQQPEQQQQQRQRHQGHGHK